jgi:hypothetical protein
VGVREDAVTTAVRPWRLAPVADLEAGDTFVPTYLTGPIRESVCVVTGPAEPDPLSLRDNAVRIPVTFSDGAAGWQLATTEGMVYVPLSV